MRKKYIIFIILIATFIIPYSVSADSSITFSYTPTQKVYTLGSVEGVESYQWTNTYSTGNLTVYNIKVYDSDNMFVAEGLTGEVPKSSKFPLRLVLETNDTDFRLDMRITYKTALPVEETNQDILSRLDKIIEKLDRLIKSMTDVTPVNNAMEHLNDSISNITKTPLGTTPQSTSNVINNLPDEIGSTGELPKMVVTFAPGVTMNVFDLSQWTKEITLIRKLLVAILYISLFLYFLQYITPKFKV